jgi:hypothetical protein
MHELAVFLPADVAGGFHGNGSEAFMSDTRLMPELWTFLAISTAAPALTGLFLKQRPYRQGGLTDFAT